MSALALLPNYRYLYREQLKRLLIKIFSLDKWKQSLSLAEVPGGRKKDPGFCFLLKSKLKSAVKKLGP